jgi:uncharacterized membrane protein HdeD (DUF308 family)
LARVEPPVLLRHPIDGVVSFTLVLNTFFIVDSIFQIAASVWYRDAFPHSWGWMGLSGFAGPGLAKADHRRLAEHPVQ